MESVCQSVHLASVQAFQELVLRGGRVCMHMILQTRCDNLDLLLLKMVMEFVIVGDEETRVMLWVVRRLYHCASGLGFYVVSNLKGSYKRRYSGPHHSAAR